METVVEELSSPPPVNLSLPSNQSIAVSAAGPGLCDHELQNQRWSETP